MQIKINMREISRQIEDMEMEDIILEMDMYMKVNGKKIKKMDMEFLKLNLVIYLYKHNNIR